MLTERAVLKRLADRVANAGGSVNAAARQLGIPQPTLAAALDGTRPLGDALLRTIGLRRVVRYEQVRGRSSRSAG
jgi:hypothetical protein